MRWCLPSLLILVASCGDGAGPSMFEIAATSESHGGGADGSGSGGALGDDPEVEWNGEAANPDEAVVGEGTPITGTTKHGTVALSQVDVPDHPPTPSAYAAFQEAPATWAGCTRYDVGVCYFYECAADANPVHAIINSGYSAASAGILSVSTGGTEQLLEQDASGLYSLSAESLWEAPGSEIVVKATGADVPAFEAKLVAPDAATLISPNVNPLDPLEWVQTKHLPLTWTARSSGQLRVSIYDTEFELARPALFCTFPVQAGEGVIPAAALMEMELGGPYMLQLSVRAESSMSAGDWGISVSAAAVSNTEAGEVNSMFWLRADPGAAQN